MYIINSAERYDHILHSFGETRSSLVHATVGALSRDWLVHELLASSPFQAST